MERERVIECLEKEVNCLEAVLRNRCNFSGCTTCPNNYSEKVVDVVKAAIELLEGEEKT